MNNNEFLTVITKSFKKFQETGSRSNEKLKILHGAIARDIQERLIQQNTKYRYSVESYGIGKGTEATLSGEYVDKNVDIAIKRDGIYIAGIAVKFVMQNYSQNSNNYFENMLGETANLRSKNNKGLPVQYYHIVIIPENMPYFESSSKVKKIEYLTENNLKKYRNLFHGNIDSHAHIPNKTLLQIIKLRNLPSIDNKEKIREYYKSTCIEPEIIVSEKFSSYVYGNAGVLNDYEEFAEKVVHGILSV